MTSQDPPENITIPPPEYRQVIDKTAGYVFRNGPSFEIRIREKERENVKFAFLLDDDPYNEYYKWSLSQLREGKTNGTEQSSVVTTITQTEEDKIAAPPEFKFFTRLPPVSAQDLDVIRLCAQFVAKNGPDYAAALRKHVSNSVQFEFMVKGHSLYPVFESFVEQYRLILHPTQDIQEKLSTGARNAYSVLDRAFARAEYLKKQEIEAADNEAQLFKERIEYASIDWDSFVVVETIEFTEVDDVAELPLPLSLAELQYRSLEQKKANSLLEEAPPDFDPNQEIQRKVFEASGDSGEEMVVQEGESVARPVPKGMKIRSAGESRLKRQYQQQQQQFTSSGEKLLKCPLTGQLIPESKFAQHITILLRDPKFKEERKRYESKVTQTNLSTDEIYENIKRLANGRNEEDEEPDSKKAKVVPRWDGYKSSVETVQQQAAKMYSKSEIEEMRRERREKERAIGPH
ncbi:unnamed protein product [Kuraishia capsulata CBS 1993]|uniref:SURP motif domain-containing protein n=1 Tax=Kuraishia capsulata CBS 1993 TaxID=1382522 RepID=W6MG84_9ASCO|nr:uncharacterized protein KUCA_T00000737001 [Kuraishia capsulata CBS 1993]CDK24771.1 unnamed protein product [Kuraishia capsulata CBS 1993]